MSPIDCFLRSLAADYGELAVGVILSGTGADGTAGVEAVKTAGGITFAEDSASAKFSTMPENAVASGFVDFVLSPERIGIELARISRHPGLQQRPAPKVEESADRGKCGASRQDATAAQRPRRRGFHALQEVHAAKANCAPDGPARRSRRGAVPAFAGEGGDRKWTRFFAMR